jgi:hypothetical protein
LITSLLPHLIMIEMLLFKYFFSMVFYVVNNGFDTGNFSSISCLNHKAYQVTNVGFGSKKIIPDSVGPESSRSDKFLKKIWTNLAFLVLHSKLYYKGKISKFHQIYCKL